LTTLKIATITFTTGFAGYALTSLSSTIVHKLKGTRSFDISSIADKVVIKKSLTTTMFNAIEHFFFYSMLTFVVAANSSLTNAYLQLLVIYSLCLIAVLIEYFNRKSFKVVIDKTKQLIKIKGQDYSLIYFSEFEISDRSFWLTDDFDSFGLYIRSVDNKRELIYGYSLLKDIQQLKNDIESRMNSR
jgi:hypothetical protein